MLKKITAILLSPSIIFSASVVFAEGDHNKIMHNMHVAINHSLSMATEGSNLIMTANKNEAPGVDEINKTHGEMMLANAEKLLDEVLNSPAMEHLHAEGETKETSKMMFYTHVLIDNANNYIQLLRSM